MKITLAYVFPDLLHATYIPLARRFVESYMEHPPGDADHDILVCVNYGTERMLKEYEKLFSPLCCRFMMHNNEGKDIGAFQAACAVADCDLLMCVGAPIHFTRAGWMDRIEQAYIENGPALYGCWGFHQPRDHIRTTAFWLPPQLLASYPHPVDNSLRYEFEHGVYSITEHARNLGLERYMVTWKGVYPRDVWQHVDKHESLFLDQHYDRMP